MDVAGLVPGASEGKGLGNKFLDDLRHAHVLLHIVDASGTTDANGKETKGYDPSNDVDWLYGEIRAWIYNNLMKNWHSMVRKNTMGGLAVEKALMRQVSGYGANLELCTRVIAKLPAELSAKSLDTWSDEEVGTLVDVFLRERFPTIIVLNKMDHPDASDNIDLIFQRYKREADTGHIVLTSAMSEIFLRKLRTDGLIHYRDGTDTIWTADDEDPRDPETQASEPPLPTLKPMDEKWKARLEKVLDMVIYRYNSTGCVEAIQTAVELGGQLVPIYPVKSLQHYGPVAWPNSTSSAMTTSSSRTASHDVSDRSKAAFVDCLLVPKSTSIRDLKRMLFSASEVERMLISVEREDGCALADDEIVQPGGAIYRVSIKHPS